MNAILALVIANIIWGAASPIFKYALTDIPPFTLAFIRFFFAGLIFIPFIFRKFNLHSLKRRDWLELLTGSFFGIVVNISFFFLGVQKTASINMPIIASTGPLFIFLFSVIFLHEKPQRKVLTGMALAFFGALVIIFSTILFDGKTKTDISQFEGNIMIVIATAGAVLHPIILKNVLNKISAYMATFLGFMFASLIFLPLMIIEQQKWSFTQLHIQGWTGIIFGVFFSSALAYCLFLYGLSKLKTQEIGLFTYIDPVVAVLIAAPLLGEYPNIYYFIGSLLVFIGIFFAENRLHWHPIHKLRNSKFQNPKSKQYSMPKIQTPNSLDI